MKKLTVVLAVIFSLIGCGSDDSSPSGSIAKVSILQNEISEHGIFVADTATVAIEHSGDISSRSVNWKVDDVLVGTGDTYKVKNKDWRKKLEACVLFEGVRTCSELLNVLPRHPVSASQPIQYAY
ncbi:hypothetical protein [Aliivibrio fischeri]|uniref:hypothetical protein n=1 Tax=Aliivibrio fischeri TaxID=668 RepID=UPI00166E9F1D|nr:hypothetical protein [Aliivibrio fischeri]USR97968.1 hypothetical protein AVFI_16005 [Aliivibrio fischeri ATCC 7744 = JCM 18803 = DSM 507]GGK20128.1 hypothetical protein GCM10007987_00050 [Aliivibrio fischeri]